MKKVRFLLLVAILAFSFPLVQSKAFAKEFGPFVQRDGTTSLTLEFPDQVTEGMRSVVGILRANQSYFEDKPGYAYVFEFGKSSGECSRASTATRKDSQTLEFSFDPTSGCPKDPRGDYSLSVSSSPMKPVFGRTDKYDSLTPKNSSVTISYAVVPTGGEPRLVANCKVKENTALSFNIENAQAGMTYSLWIHKAYPWEKKTYTPTSA